MSNQPAKEFLSLSFVSALVAEGPSAIKEARKHGFKSEHLVGPGREIFNFISEYAQKFSAIPDPSLIMGRTGMSVLAPTGKAAFFASELLRLERVETWQMALSGASQQLSDIPDPDKVEEIIATAMAKARSMRPNGIRIESINSYGPSYTKFYEDRKAGIMGIPYPWETMNKGTSGMWPQNLILWVARLGIGKCTKYNTLITDPVTGVQRTIEDIYKTDSTLRVHTWGGNGIFNTPITAKVDTGYKQCFKLKLKSGREISVTPEHPLMSVDGWKRTDQFKVGEAIATPNQLPFPESPEKLSAAEVELLAILLSEGSYTSRATGFSTSDPVILDIATQAAATLDTDVRFRSGYDYAFCLRTGTQNAVREILRKHGIDGTLSKNKIFPEAIYRLPAEQLSRFLSVFWMCDGYVDESAGITLASEKMVRQIQSLLLRFGIQSSVSYKQATCNGQKFDAWRLRVIAADLIKFQTNIPLWAHKAERLDALVSRTRNPNAGQPKVSTGLKKAIEAAINGMSFDRRKQVAKELGWSGKYNILPRDITTNTVRLRRFRTLAEHVDLSAYTALLDPSLFWDPIVSIEDDGIQKIYDLTVEPTACFIANDLLVHNTFTMINQAIVAHQAGYRTLVVTVEMTPEEISQRYFNMILKENPTQYLQGQFPKHIEDKMYQLVQDLMSNDDNNLRIASGEFEFSMSAVSDAVDDFLPDIVIIDGAYLLDPEVRTEAKRTEKVAQVFNEIKLLAVTKNIPVVVSTQFNRDAAKNGKEGANAANIGLTDVAGQHATVAMALMQDEAQKTNKQMSMQQLKVRNGSFPNFDCNWDISRMDFSELPGKWSSPGIAANPFAPQKQPAQQANGGPLFSPDNDNPLLTQDDF